VYVKFPPATELTLVDATVVCPPQIVWFAERVSTGVGLTVIVYVMGGPLHPFRVGVTVYVTVCTELELFVIVIEGRLLDPDAVKPVTDAELATPVHAKVVPVALGVQVTAVVFAPEQIV
jgi:hypothetical protein